MKSNPLSTRFVQPGRIAWQATGPQQSLETLVNYFTNQLNWRAAIVGPHGSGKSTLLEHLVPLLGTLIVKRAAYLPEPQAATLGSTSQAVSVPPTKSRWTVWLQMRGRRDSARLLKETHHQWSQSNSLLVIDGYEQLSLLQRARVVLVTRRRAVGLLLTSHRRTALPTLVETCVDAQLAQRLLDGLLPQDLPHRTERLNTQRLHKLLKQHHGNLREVFMQMYDEIENAS